MAVAPSFDVGSNATDGQFHNDLHRFVSTCQVLAGEVEERQMPLGDLAKAMEAVLPHPRSPQDFLVLRSITVEFATKAVQAIAPKAAGVVWPLARVAPFSEDLGTVLVRCLSRVEQRGGNGGRARSIQRFRTKRALALIAARCREPDVSLESIAMTVGVSSQYLSRLLRAHHGCGFRIAVRRARVAAACSLLETSFKSIKEVASEVGYGSTSALDRHFRRECGLTPVSTGSSTLSKGEKAERVRERGVMQTAKPSFRSGVLSAASARCHSGRDEADALLGPQRASATRPIPIKSSSISRSWLPSSAVA